MGDRVDLPNTLPDNSGVEFVSVALRVLKREQMPEPSGVGELLEKWRMYDGAQEQVWVLSFNAQNMLRKITRVAQGSYDQVDVPIAAVMSAVLLSAADRFWMVHNHPGGVAFPSEADVDLTNKVMQAANTVGIRFEDHVILAAGNDSFSFRQSGLIRTADEARAAAAANETLVIRPERPVHRTKVREGTDESA